MKKSFWISLSLLALFLFLGHFTSTAQQADDRPFASLIRNLEVGKPVSHGNLTIIPVYLTKTRDKTEYITLDEALANEWIAVTEIEGGRVPQVKISNLSKHTIYLMGGEILTGCKQDRILAVDILLGPWTKNLLAPVYCVEQGRWTHTSSRFYSKNNIGTPSLRAKAQERKQEAQAEIWNTIASQNRKMGVASDTSAYQDAYENKSTKDRIIIIEKKMKRIPRLEKDTVGVVIGIGGRVISTDIFVNPHVFQKQWPKILRSSALSSISSASRGSLDREDAALFLKSFMNKKFRSKKGLDLGFELSIVDNEVNAHMLTYKGSVLHMAAFPQEKDRIKVVERDTPEQRIRFIREEVQQAIRRSGSGE